MILVVTRISLLLIASLLLRNGHGLDAGIIAYFENGCPDGWSQYSNLNGRVAVAAGYYSGTREDSVFESKTFTFGQSGGEMDHKLTISEIPSHNHDNGDYKYIMKIDGDRTSDGQDDTSGEPNVKYVGALLSVGGDGAHNNLPPYYVLYACIKDSDDSDYALLADFETFESDTSTNMNIIVNSIDLVNNSVILLRNETDYIINNRLVSVGNDFTTVWNDIDSLESDIDIIESIVFGDLIKGINGTNVTWTIADDIDSIYGVINNVILKNISALDDSLGVLNEKYDILGINITNINDYIVNKIENEKIASLEDENNELKQNISQLNTKVDDLYNLVETLENTVNTILMTPNPTTAAPVTTSTTEIEIIESTVDTATAKSNQNNNGNSNGNLWNSDDNSMFTIILICVCIILLCILITVCVVLIKTHKKYQKIIDFNDHQNSSVHDVNIRVSKTDSSNNNNKNTKNKMEQQISHSGLPPMPLVSRSVTLQEEISPDPHETAMNNGCNTTKGATLGVEVAGMKLAMEQSMQDLEMIGVYNENSVDNNNNNNQHNTRTAGASTASKNGKIGRITKKGSEANKSDIYENNGQNDGTKENSDSDNNGGNGGNDDSASDSEVLFEGNGNAHTPHETATIGERMSIVSEGN